MKYLTVLPSLTLLVACGGGGSGGPDAPASPSAAAPSAAVSPVIAELAKYEGVWRQDCVDHMRQTKTATATGGTGFSVTTKEEFFDNADCTGALVATGSFGQPDETVQYTATLANASVQLLTGETITADVDPATSRLAVARFTITGHDVRPIGDVFNSMGQLQTVTVIAYSNGAASIARDVLNGELTSGAFLMRNGELLALSPIPGTAKLFRVSHRYLR